MSADNALGQTIIEAHKKLMADMRASIYTVESREVTTTVAKKSLKLAQARELKLIKQVFDRIRNQVSVPEGAKIVIQPLDRTRRIIIFGSAVREGQRGADYAAKVTVNAETGAILELLVGS